jgi:hypothetical protein
MRQAARIVILLVFGLGGVAAAANNFSGSEVAAYWQFESGANFAVDTKNTITLTELGDVLEETTLYAEGACSAHSPTADKFTIGDSNLPSGFPTKSGGSGRFSVSIWFRMDNPPGIGSTAYLVDKFNMGGAMSWGVSLYNNAGTIHVRVTEGYNGGASSDSWESTVVALSLDQWYHVGYAYDANTQDAVLRIYDAGSGDTPNKTSGTAYLDPHHWTNAMSLTTADLTVMCRSNASTNYLAGYVDELVVFNTALQHTDFDDIRRGEYGSAPGPATNPDPAASPPATDVSVAAILSWTADPAATSHDVCFGTSDPPSFIQNQAGTTYDPPGDMDADQTYYWRIDEKNDYGTTQGTVWSFTTAAQENSFAADPECMALWRFDTVGDIGYDSIGSHVNGLSNAGATQDGTTKKQGAYAAQFVASEDDYMNLADASLGAGFPLKSGDTNKKISVCLWFRASTLPGSGSRSYLYSKYDPAGNARSLAVALVNTSGSTYVNLLLGYNSGVSEEPVAHTKLIAADTWYHVTATFDDATKHYMIRVHDGATAWGQAGATTNNISVNSAAVYLGAVYGDTATDFDGRLDEVVVFKDILTAEEADAIATFTYTGPSTGGGGGSIFRSVVE